MNQPMQQTISPIDGTVYLERETASGKQLEATLAKATAAQPAWKRTSVATRAEICRRMAAWLIARADDIGHELTMQIGRPIAYSPFEIRRGFAERVNYMCDIAEGELCDIFIEPKELAE